MVAGGPFGPKGIEDIPWYTMQGVGAGLNLWAGVTGGAIDKIMGGVIPVLVMNRDTGKIVERVLLEQVYFTSIAVGVVPPAIGGTWIPIWDFEPEVPDVLLETIILKVATGIIDIAAAKLAPPAALLARAIERSAAAGRGGVASIAVIRGIFTNLGARGLFMTSSGQKLGTGNAGGDRLGWPLIASSSFNVGYGETAGNAKLSVGTNPVDNVLPTQISWDGEGTPIHSVAYGGLYSGVATGNAEGVQLSRMLGDSMFPLVMTPGRVLSITTLNLPTLLVPFSTSTWPQNGCVSIWWSEFSID